ncbi:MAG TPA: carboxypeptidase-like regulatory domain-containing protein, partial [Planctomycetota bacterium]|nr:carboxypeptidase-like regulatory domain-containing protein [Planctomycetota bacterium]
ISVAADERVRVDFRLRAACTLSGKVLDASGAPVDKASIFVRDEAGRPLDRFSVTATESNGTFVQKGLGAGRYTVSARTDALVSDEATVVLTEGEEAHVELRLEDGTMLVVTLSNDDGTDIDASFTVTDEKGRQVNGIYSLSDLMKIMTEGGFDSKHQRIGPLPRGKYTVTASSATGAKATKAIVLTGQSEKKITLKLGN